MPWRVEPSSKSGEVSSTSSAASSRNRFTSLMRTPAEVQHKLVSWNPADHSELKVWFHRSISSNPKPADFSGLNNLPDNSSIQYLVDATSKFDANNPSLQVSKEEAQLLAASASQGQDAKTRFVNVWEPDFSRSLRQFSQRTYRLRYLHLQRR